MKQAQLRARRWRMAAGLATLLALLFALLPPQSCIAAAKESDRPGTITIPHNDDGSLGFGSWRHARTSGATGAPAAQPTAAPTPETATPIDPAAATATGASRSGGTARLLYIAAAIGVVVALVLISRKLRGPYVP